MTLHPVDLDKPLQRPLTVTDRGRLVGYLRLAMDLIIRDESERARRVVAGVVVALENR